MRISGWGDTVEPTEAELGNPHLSIFRPYSRPPNHEDQLTRAFLIVTKLVPEAHDALLALTGNTPLAELPKPEFDLQTETLIPPGADSGKSSVKKLASIFLTPDEDVEDLDAVQASDRRARYDGVIRYGAELLVVLESKLFSGVDSKQAVEINPKDATWETAEPLHIRWHEVLDRWWDLSESKDIEVTRAEIIREFFDYAETYFGDLLPFTDLAKCKNNERRRLRRLRSLLQEATGLPGTITPRAEDPATGRQYPPGVNVKLPKVQVTAADRVGMWIENDAVHLAMWLGELKAQYRYLYRQPDRVESLIKLAEQPGWKLDANFHIGYRFSRSFQRWYPTRHLSGIDYVRQWVEDVHHNAGQRTREQIQTNGFHTWLTERHYAKKKDLKRLDEWIEQESPGRKFHLRPSVQIARSWDLPQAAKLDAEGEFGHQVKTAIDQILTAVNEPTLDEM
jgi:hypothetical protein